MGTNRGNAFVVFIACSIMLMSFMAMWVYVSTPTPPLRAPPQQPPPQPPQQQPPQQPQQPPQQPPKPQPPGGGGTGTGGGDCASGDCVAMINCYRAKEGKPPLLPATEDENACANKSAAYDAAQGGFHASFKTKLCPTASSQCECRGMDVARCTRTYYNEKFTGEQNQGHYKIMMGDFKRVACGSDGKGFLTHNFYR